MQNQSYHREPTQRKLFGIEFAPPRVRAHGLRDAHTYPLVSMGKGHAGRTAHLFVLPLLRLGTSRKSNSGPGIPGLA